MSKGLNIVEKSTKRRMPASKDLRFVSRPQVAYALGLSATRVTNLTKRAKDPLPIAFKETGKVGTPIFFDLRAVIQWQLNDSSPGTKAHDLNIERARLAREQTESYVLKNEVARGEYVPKDMLEAALSKVVGMVVAGLDSVPGILKKRSNASTKQITQVRKVLNQLRSDLAGIQLDDT